MKKYFILFLITNVLFGQKNYKVDYIYTDAIGMSMGSSLYTNNIEALFQIHDKRDSGIIDLPNGDVSFVENDEMSRFCYSNKELSYYRFVTCKTEIVYTDLYNKKTNWEIDSSSKKNIAGYNCTKAKLFINSRRYTAWFTTEIPIKFGPMKLHNLPGLILEVREDSGFFEIKFKSIKKISDIKELEKAKSYVLNKKTMYSYQEYEKKIVDIEVNNKIRWISVIKKMDAEDDTTTSIDDNMSNKEVLDNLLDYPTNLISELKKYQYN